LLEGYLGPHANTLRELLDYKQTKYYIPTTTWIQACCYKDDQEPELQSEIDRDDNVLAPDVEQSETLQFFHEDGGHVGGIAGTVEEAPDKGVNTEIEDYLSRPICIANVSWTENTRLDLATIKPWQLYLNNAFVKKKINNYRFLRGDLELTFQINASPFYFGRVLFSYLPCDADTPAPIITDTGSYRHIMLYSQRPKVEMDVSKSETAAMLCPFIYPREFVDLTNNTEVGYLGALSYMSYGTLDNANNVAGETINIHVWAKIVNYELAGATVAAELQSSFKKKKPATKSFFMGASQRTATPAKSESNPKYTVSGVASSVAKTAGMLKHAPVIGSYASGVEVAAKGVAGVASHFGYTNVPNVEGTSQYTPACYPHAATQDIIMPRENLVIDPKNMITIDTERTTGIKDDETLVRSLITKESFWYSVTWAKTDASFAQLAHYNVTPMIVETDGKTGYNNLYATPTALTTSMFYHWRGSMTYRVVVVGTPYHKGRLLISWDPAGESITTDKTGATYSIVVDIGRTKEFTFTVPYLGQTAFKRSGDFWNTTARSGIYNDDYQNGKVSFQVLTKLTSPQSSVPVSLLIFAKCEPDFLVANPRDLDLGLKGFIAQSNIVEDEEEVESYLLGEYETQDYPNIFKSYMGEAVESTKCLMQRLSNYMNIPINNTSSGTSIVASLNIPRRPVYPGYDTSNGIFTVNEIVGVGTEKYNPNLYTPLTWVSQCFVGCSGSINYAIQLVGGEECKRFRVRRLDPGQSTAYWTNDVSDFTDTTNYAKNGMKVNARIGDSGQTGQSITASGFNPVLNFTAPMYSRFKFLGNGRDSRVGFYEGAFDQLDLEAIYNASTATPSNKFVYCMQVAAGPDYALHCFLNVPTIQYHATTPTAP